MAPERAIHGDTEAPRRRARSTPRSPRPAWTAGSCWTAPPSGSTRTAAISPTCWCTAANRSRTRRWSSLLEPVIVVEGLSPGNAPPGTCATSSRGICGWTSVRHYLVVDSDERLGHIHHARGLGRRRRDPDRGQRRARARAAGRSGPCDRGPLRRRAGFGRLNPVEAIRRRGAARATGFSGDRSVSGINAGG